MCLMRHMYFYYCSHMIITYSLYLYYLYCYITEQIGTWLPEASCPKSADAALG